MATVTKITTNIPSELPAAHLYLDDIDGICSILREAYESPDQGGRDPDSRTITISFSTTSLLMDTTDDLKEHGGDVRDFSIHLKKGRQLESSEIVNFSRGFSPTIRTYRLTDQGQLATYLRVKEIFERRQFRLTNMIHSLPIWIKFCGLTVLGSVCGVIGGHISGKDSFGMTALIISGLMFVVLTLTFKSSKVSFVRFHDRRKLLAEDRKGYWKNAISALLGYSVPKLLDYVVHHWPK